jgi:hypothetical protein
MKKIIILIAMAVTFIAPTAVLAADPNANIDCSGVSGSAFCRDRQVSGNPLFGSSGIITKAAQILVLITGVISVFIMTIAGLRFVTSGGDPGKVESARSAILYSVIGVVVTISAQAIVSLVLNNL